jgi:hypothetical protein
MICQRSLITTGRLCGLGRPRHTPIPAIAFLPICCYITMSNLPAPLVEEGYMSHMSRMPSNQAKAIRRPSKRSIYLQEHDTAVIDTRHTRVCKACERCRMKKTKVCQAAYHISHCISDTGFKCNGEYPCKRCKDDGLVCTAAKRKKSEFKPLPRG